MLSKWIPSQQWLSEQWAGVALAALLAILLIRLIFLNGLYALLKIMGKETYSQILKASNKSSYIGWLLHFVFVALTVIAVCYPQYGIPGVSRHEGFLLAVIALLSGILLHARALQRAGCDTIKNRSEIDSAL